MSLYEDGEYLSKFLEQQGIEVLDMPEKGNLDLNLVLEDEFFFS